MSGRQFFAACAHAAKVAGTNVSMRPRTACAKTGAAPPVETPITSGERLTIAPMLKSLRAGRSVRFNGTPTALAASRMACASSSVSTTPKRRVAPVRSSDRQARSKMTIVSRAAAISRSLSETTGAKTSTCAPAAAARSAFQAALSEPPIMMTRRPLRSKKTGKVSSGCINSELTSSGLRVTACSYGCSCALL